jgi:hypothetical protein
MPAVAYIIAAIQLNFDTEAVARVSPKNLKRSSCFTACFVWLSDAGRGVVGFLGRVV